MKPRTLRGTHPRSLANLVKWQKGQSGNPGGRVRKKPITERYEQIAETEVEEAIRQMLGLPAGATYGDAIALGQARAATKGNPGAAREIREAIEGLTAAEHTGPQFSVVIINAAHRPDWSAMKRANETEDPKA